MLVEEGQSMGPFRAGRHTLDINNYPYLAKILKIPFGQRSPFTAEIRFVNRAIPLDVKWGTQDPTPLQCLPGQNRRPMKFCSNCGRPFSCCPKCVTEV